MDQRVDQASVFYFFTSCTRSDGWPTITRFHADLEYRLRVQEGLWVSGSLGAQTDTDSLLQCGVTEVGVMIALYSPLYFQNPVCGLEWAVFRDRMKHHALLRNRDASSCLIPLSWKPVPEDARPPGIPAPEEWPDAESRDQQHPDHGRSWTGQGLFELMNADSPEADDMYFALIGRLARRIVEARQIGLTGFDTAELPRSRPAFGSIPPQGTPAGRPDLTGTNDRQGRTHDYSHPPSSPVSVAINYVGADQPWADWMTAILESDGNLPIRQVRWETEAESLSDTVNRAQATGERVVVIFSRSYYESGETQPTEWEEVFAGPDKDWLIPVQIDAQPRPVLVRRGVPVLQLNGSGEQAARQLCEAVREPSTPVPGGRGGNHW